MTCNFGQSVLNCGLSSQLKGKQNAHLIRIMWKSPIGGEKEEIERVCQKNIQIAFLFDQRFDLVL